MGDNGKKQETNVNVDNDAQQKLEEILAEETGEIRVLTGWQKYIVPTIAFFWSLFQLSISSWLLLDSIIVRSIHMAFAMAILYFSIPFFKKPKKHFKFLWSRDNIPVIDFVLAIVGAISSMYIFLNWEGISARAGMPNTMDIVFGVIMMLCLLEGARRAIGPALTIIAVIFTLYAFFAEYMPEVLAFKSVSLAKYLNQEALSTEGVYGIPLYVSARVVFLYVLFGALLDKAGGGKLFIDLALCFLGKYKGGPAKAAVLSSGLTGMVSGSSIANIVTTGTFTIPLMKKIGYPPTKAAATEVAASIDGQLAPPIMGAAAFIIAEYLNVPYIAVVKAAAIPAFVSYVSLLYITHIEASKLGMRGLTKEEIPSLKETLKKGFYFLIPIAALLYELIILRHSPDKSAFNAIMWLMVVLVIRDVILAKMDNRALKEGFFEALATIRDGMISGAKNMVPVAIACASAGIIVGIVNMGIGGMITQIVENLSGGNIYAMLFITAFASLLIGMGLPTTATYIVMASLVAPIIVEVGGSNGFIVPLMAAHLFCFYFGMLADDTPPVGLASYAAAALAGSEPIPTGIQGFFYDIRTAIIPFMFIFNPDLILHHINSWPLAILIFVMACLGGWAFASATQGWTLTKNKIYDMIILLGACFFLFRPDVAARILHFDNKYFGYILGLALWALVIIIQKLRIKAQGGTGAPEPVKAT